MTVDLMRTTKTYKTRANALKKLEEEAEFLGVPMSDIHYLIAVHKDGRYAPVVVRVSGGDSIAFIHRDITVVGI